MLLPVRDAAGTLDACLDSLLGQRLGDHEILAVDDGSRDGSLDLLERRRRQDPRLRVLRTGRRGLAAALGLALAEARAPWVARMDADDVAHPDRLLLQIRRLRAEPGLEILGSRVALLGPALGDGMRRYVEWSNGLLDHGSIRRELFVESPLVHPSVMMRTATLRGLGGYRDFDGPEDYDLWLRAAASGLRFGKLEEVLLEWRDSAGRLTRSDPRYREDRFQRLKLEALERGPLVPGRPVVVWGAGPVGKSWARALRIRGHRLGGFVEVDPRKIGQVIHGALVASVEAALLPGALHLAAVSGPEARRRIREAGREKGLVEGESLVAVA